MFGELDFLEYKTGHQNKKSTWNIVYRFVNYLPLAKSISLVKNSTRRYCIP